jgi:predicted dehydrogenase
MAKAKKIRAGIIGCGNIAGWNELDPLREKPCTHIGAYRSRQEIEVAGCCDVDVKRAEKFAKQFGIPFATNSIAHLLAKQPDLVSICVPYKKNFDVLRQVVNDQNKPEVIFLEKPIADSFAKARQMVAWCREKKIKLYVNNRRLSPFYQTFEKILKDEFNNELISVSAWCSSGMHAIGIHMVDLLRNICGEPKEVFAAREKERIEKLPYSHNFTADDPRFTAFLNFRRGAKATLFNSAKTDFTYFEIEALCKTGKIRAVDNGNRLVFQKKRKPGPSTLSYRLGEEREVRITPRPLFKQLIDEILDGNYKTSPISGREALKSYQVIEAMKKSAQTNRIQKLGALNGNGA